MSEMDAESRAFLVWMDGLCPGILFLSFCFLQGFQWKVSCLPPLLLRFPTFLILVWVFSFKAMGRVLSIWFTTVLLVWTPSNAMFHLYSDCSSWCLCLVSYSLNEVRYSPSRLIKSYRQWAVRSASFVEYFEWIHPFQFHLSGSMSFWRSKGSCRVYQISSMRVTSAEYWTWRVLCSMLQSSLKCRQIFNPWSWISQYCHPTAPFLLHTHLQW